MGQISISSERINYKKKYVKKKTNKQTPFLNTDSKQTYKEFFNFTVTLTRQLFKRKMQKTWNTQSTGFVN